MTRTEKLEALLLEAIETAKELADEEYSESFERRVREALALPPESPQVSDDGGAK